MLCDLDDYAAALPLYQRALQINEKALGPDNPELVRPLMGIGRAYLKLVQPRPALLPLERAYKPSEGIPAQRRAECSYRLGIALMKAKLSPARVNDLFASARAVLLQTPKTHKAVLAHLDSLLAQRRMPPRLATARPRLM